MLRSLSNAPQKTRDHYLDSALGIHDDLHRARISEELATHTPTAGGVGGKRGRDEAVAAGSCVVCYDAAASMALSPCGHLCVCEKCVRALPSGSQSGELRCPICRVESDGPPMRIYLAGTDGAMAGGDGGSSGGKFSRLQATAGSPSP